jgi:hypothetical protein
VLVFVAKLAELVVAVAELRDAQRLAAQASAARAAAERLHAATRTVPDRSWPARVSPAARPHRGARSAADLARLDHPGRFDSPRTVSPGSLRRESALAPTPRSLRQPRRPRGQSP